MKREILKLGTIVTDTVTGTKGMLTMYNVDLNNNQLYLFQPSQINPKTQEPVNSFWLTGGRIDACELYEVILPINILGTHVEDKATGFKGTALSCNYHLNGCVHIEVKPKGFVISTGESIKSFDFDLRRLKGDSIVEMNDTELEKSKIENPSPEYKPSMMSR